MAAIKGSMFAYVCLLLVSVNPFLVSAQLGTAAAPIAAAPSAASTSTASAVADDPSIGTCRLLDSDLNVIPLTTTDDAHCGVCAGACVTYGVGCQQILFGLYTIPRDSLGSFCTSTCANDAYGKVETCCVLPGVACHDPHFTGFDGTEFEFKGAKGLTFALISEGLHQLNSLFDDFNTGADNMFMKAFGLMYGDKLRLNVTAAPEGMLVTVNGKSLDNLALDVEVDFTGVSLLYHRQSGNVSSANDFSYVQVTTPDIKFTFFKQPGGEHLNLNVNLLASRAMDMHGVLGQTYGWKGLAEPEFDGTDEDYVVSDLFASDFKHSRFTSKVAASDMHRKLMSFAQNSGIVLSNLCGGYAHTYRFCG